MSSVMCANRERQGSTCVSAGDLAMHAALERSSGSKWVRL